MDRAHGWGTGNNLGTSLTLSNWPSRFLLLSFINTQLLCITSGVSQTTWKLSGQFVHQALRGPTTYRENSLLSGSKSLISAFEAIVKSLLNI